MATYRDLQARALNVAIGEIGTTESGGNNRGPRIERYLRAVGLPPGQPWCAAFAVWCYGEAWRQLAMEGALMLPKSGKVTRLWRRTRPEWRTQKPAPGAIYCHATDPNDPESTGHCGIVWRPSENGLLVGIEGNTDDGGSREGDGVLVKHRNPSYVNLGYIDVWPPEPTRFV